MGSARERWRSMCDGDFGRGSQGLQSNLGREDGQPEQARGGRDGDPGLLTPPPTGLHLKTSPACIGPVRLVLLVQLSLLGH